MKLFKPKRFKLPGFCVKSVGEQSKDLPPGYGMETNGEKFRFVFPSGIKSSAYGNRNYAVKIAWAVYQDEKDRDSVNWKITQ